MKHLVIPDVHGRDKWKEPTLAFLSQEQDGVVVFLGDYLDSFDVQDAPMMDNFKDIIDLKKANHHRVKLLLGNHCFPYISRYYSCSGNRNSIWNQANQLYTHNLDLFQVAYQVKDTLFVHAGLSSGWLEHNRNQIETKLGEEIESWLQLRREADYAELLNSLFNSSQRSLLWQVGPRSGGYDHYDSPIWCRPMELVKDTIPGLHQVVGHTHVQQNTKVPGFGKGSFITMTDTMGNDNWEPLILDL
jgi:hypothetical protein